MRRRGDIRGAIGLDQRRASIRSVRERANWQTQPSANERARERERELSHPNIRQKRNLCDERSTDHVNPFEVDRLLKGAALATTQRTRYLCFDMTRHEHLMKRRRETKVKGKSKGYVARRNEEARSAEPRPLGSIGHPVALLVNGHRTSVTRDHAIGRGNGRRRRRRREGRLTADGTDGRGR